MLSKLTDVLHSKGNVSIKILALTTLHLNLYRYSDVLVHRLLAVAIAADASYPSLLDKKKQQSICNNLNYRHRMAQYAGRASVGLHTQVLIIGRN